MARIKKLQESGATIYPATITDAIKDHETQQGLNEILDDIDEELELAANARSPIILYADELIIDENGVISNMVEASYMPSLESFIDAWKQTKVVVVVEGENTYNGTTVFRADRGVNYLCWSNGQLRKTITYRFSGVGGQQTLTARYTEEADYAQKDGNYPQLTAGFAENIVGDGTATEEEFSFRPTAGVNRNVETTTYDYDMRSNFGARIESVKGNSVVWNQKAHQKVVGYGSVGGWYSIYSIEQDGEAYTVSNTSVSRNLASQFLSLDSTHKYLITYGVMVTSEIADGSHNFGYLGEATTQWFGTVDKSEVYNKRKDFAVFITPLTGNTFVYLGIYTPLMSQTIYSPRIHDLTQMFGAGNEPTTIEEFYSLLPKNVDLNAYNEGEMVDAHYKAIKTTGFNQWDEQWVMGYYNLTTGEQGISMENIRNVNPIKVLPNTTYRETQPVADNLLMYVLEYNEGGEYMGFQYVHNKTFITSPNTSYINFYMSTAYGTTYKNDICINIAWDEYSALNGTYAPYKPFERDLSWISQYYPEGMRRAGSVCDEIRLNSTTQKWEAVRRVGVVDLGSLSWMREERPNSSIAWRFIASLSTMTNQSPSLNLLCALYVSNTSPVGAENIDDTIAAFNSRLYINDTTYATAEELTTALSGVLLNYELATPIVTEIEEIPSLDYDVADYGTEELIVADGVKSAPFLGNIIYTPNALKTLEQVPDILRRLSALETAMTTTTTTTE